MSSLASPLVSYEQFSHLADPADGYRYELHGGEVVLVPPDRPAHKSLQGRLLRLLMPIMAKHDLTVQTEFPYRPAPQFQFWYADVACLPIEIENEMAAWPDYQCYAPPLVIEVLSPSNRETKVNKQRLASMANGTREFWVVDAKNYTVLVLTIKGFKEYGPGDRIRVLGFGFIRVSDIFATPHSPHND